MYITFLHTHTHSPTPPQMLIMEGATFPKLINKNLDLAFCEVLKLILFRITNVKKLSFQSRLNSPFFVFSLENKYLFDSILHFVTLINELYKF